MDGYLGRVIIASAVPIIPAMWRLAVPGPGNPVGCGLVDRKGEVVLPTIYQDVRVSPDSPIVSIKLSDKMGVL